MVEGARIFEERLRLEGTICAQDYERDGKREGRTSKVRTPTTSNWSRGAIRLCRDESWVLGMEERIWYIKSSNARPVC